MNIRVAAFRIVREPLQAPYGFKGGALHELWQSVVLLTGASGEQGVGAGVQSVLWSDPAVYARYGEENGNRLMSAVTRHAAFASTNREAEDPAALTSRLLDDALLYGRDRVDPGMSTVFALNALVPVDLAAWQLHARETGASSFDALLPDRFRHALGYRHETLAAAPAVGYGMTAADIERHLAAGCGILKLKLGADPLRDGDPAAMLAWDQARLDEVHRLALHWQTDLTENGKIAYYLDLNGRYDSLDRVLSLLDYAAKIGALDRIVLLEEPFAEEDDREVGQLPVRVAADESVHHPVDVARRLSAGYGAIALKPVAKTLSVSLAIAEEAAARRVPCFCADLTASPLLLEWNKAVACRLAPIPGLRTGLMEVNGPDHYANWSGLRAYHPRGDASWVDIRNGRFLLSDSYYEESGGLFLSAPAYAAMARGAELHAAESPEA